MEKEPIKRVTYEIPTSLYEQFESRWKSDDFSHESEAFRFLVRQYIKSGNPVQGNSQQNPGVGHER